MMKQIIHFILGKDTKTILNKIQLCKDETSQIKSQHKTLLQDNCAIKKHIDNREKNVHIISQQIEELKNKIAEKHIKCETLDKIAQTKGEICDYEKKFSDSTANIHGLKLSVESLQEEINKQNVQKSELEAQNKELNTDINETITNIEEYQRVNSEIKDIQNWLQAHSAELTDIQRKINTQIQEIEDTEHRDGQTNNVPEVKEKEQNASIPIGDNDQQETKAVKTKMESSIPNESIEGKRKKRDRKIKEIFDLKTGEIILADQFFEQPMNELVRWRSIFQECISNNERRFICPKCLEQIRISGRGDERGIPSIFAHKNDSVYCTKTTTGLSVEEINKRKYSLVGQSLRHKELKKIISDFLKDEESVAIGIKNVETEKRVYSSLPYFNWRQPDIQIEYKDCKIVFEIQLSTTFLSVITERDTFYRLNNYYIIWVFNFDDNEKYVDLNNLAIKDIYFANKRNAFIFDQEAMQWSKERKQLVLKCNWVDTNSQWHYPNTSERIGGEPVTLEQLNFDKQSYKPYYFDAEKPYFEEHPEMAERFAAEQRTREELIKELEQKATEEETNRKTAIEQMKITGKGVIAYKKKEKIGFKYGTTDIIKPYFTSCEERDNGTFIVGYNKKKGLVNQYGEIVRECKYINIHSLSGNAYLAEDANYFWLCNIQSYFRERTAGDKVVSTPTNERVENVELFHRNEDSPFCRFYVLDGQNLLARINNEYVFVDYDGNKIVDEKFNNLRFLSDNMIRVQRINDYLWNDMDYDGTFLSNWTKYISIEQWGNELQLGEYQTNSNSENYFDIISPNGQIISGGISSIGELINGKSQAIINGVKAEIGANGELIPEEERQFPNNYTAIKLLGYWKLINREGKDIISYKEEINSIKYIDKDLFIISKRNKFGLSGSTGIILQCQYDSIVPWASGIFKVSGYCYEELKNESGITISYRCYKIGNLEKGKAQVIINGVKAEIRANGELIPEEERLFPNKYTGIKLLGYWKLTDQKGKDIITYKDKISSIEYLNKDLFIIKYRNKFGLVGSNGFIIRCLYDSIVPWTSGIIKVCGLDYQELKNESGETIGDRYDEIGNLENGKAQVIINGVKAEIGANGEFIPEQEQFPNNYKAIKLLAYWKLIDREGKDIITYNEEISSINYIEKDLFIITKCNKFGLAGSNGIIIQCKYSSIVPWTSGIFKVCSNSYQELKDESGKTIGNRYNEIGNLENGKAEVRYRGATGHIDAKGIPIPDIEIKLTDGFVKYGFMMKWGLKDSVGNNVLNCEYMEITSFHGYYYVITLDGELKKTNIKTQNVVPVKGRKIKETKNSIIYNVGDVNLLVRFTIAKKIWEDQIPDTTDLLIKHIDKEHKGSGRYYHTNLRIYAKPYSQQEKEKKSNNNKKIDIDEIVNGVITKVKNGSAIVKLDDGGTIFIHKSYFSNNVINSDYKGHNITAKMIGFDDVHQKEKWEIIELNAPQV